RRLACARDAHCANVVRGEAVHTGDRARRTARAEVHVVNDERFVTSELVRAQTLVSPGCTRQARAHEPQTVRIAVAEAEQVEARAIDGLPQEQPELRACGERRERDAVARRE